MKRHQVPTAVVCPPWAIQTAPTARVTTTTTYGRTTPTDHRGRRATPVCSRAAHPAAVRISARPPNHSAREPALSATAIVSSPRQASASASARGQPGLQWASTVRATVPTSTSVSP